MWHFSQQQRVKQKRILAYAGILFFTLSLLITPALFFSDIAPSHFNSIMITVMICSSAGAVFWIVARFWAWHQKPIWDFIFNQLSILLIIAGYLVTLWRSIADKSLISLFSVFGGIALIGLGSRVESLHQHSFDLSNPELIKSLVGMLVWGTFGLILALLLHMPALFFVGLIAGLLLGVDKGKDTVSENLRAVLSPSLKFGIMSMLLTAGIGTLFTILLFGATVESILLGIFFGGGIGILVGILSGAL